MSTFTVPKVALLFQSKEKHKYAQSVRTLELAHGKHIHVYLFYFNFLANADEQQS
jgi:hypothetical protein